MEKDILIVPDVHGRDFWFPALDYQGEIVFLGDYNDPYSQEKITDAMAYQMFLKIVDFKKQNPDRVTLLIGNHEMPYYDKFWNAGRFSEVYYPQIHEILTAEETKGLFQLCKQVGHFLFIHAGVTKHWYDRHYEKFEKSGGSLEEQLNKVFFERMNIFWEAGRYRGGWNKTGSPLWADLRELNDETEPFAPDIFQIIGHTQRMESDPIIRKNYGMLDNRQLYILHHNNIEKYIV